MTKRNTTTKKPTTKSVRNPRSVFTVSRGVTNEQQEIVRKFLGIQNVVQGVLGTLPPPHNPYELISFTDGYHWRCIRHLVNATVGQGYDASDALREHIDSPNPEQSFNSLLKETAHDYFTHGWHAVHVLRSDVTANIWHSPSIKTRVKVDRQTLKKSFVRFEYEPWLGWMSYVEEPEFGIENAGSGVRMMNNISLSGNRYYGEPDYINIKGILLLNWSIVSAAMRWFEQGLMSDLAIIEKGMGREDDEISAMKDYLGKSMKGVDNAHKILYMQVAPDESIEFKTLSSDFPGKESSELKATNRDEIIVGHGLYPRLVGVATAGALGGSNEVQAQFGAFKKLVADPIQRDIEEWWQYLFRDLGFPEWKTFKLRPLSVVTSKETMDMYAEGVASNIIPIEEAQEEWHAEKSARGMINYLKKLRKELV